MRTSLLQKLHAIVVELRAHPMVGERPIGCTLHARIARVRSPPMRAVMLTQEEQELVTSANLTLNQNLAPTEIARRAADAR
jgi:hypothetical protein